MKTVRDIELGDLVKIVMGQAPASKDCNFEGRGTPFVKVGEFGSIRPTIREWTTNPLKLARSTDVLLCVVGATCGKINLGEECAIGRSVAAIRPKPEKLKQLFLYYFMMTLVERLREGSVGAAQTVISKEMISSVRIPALPLTEQERIVGILDEAFDGIAKAKALAKANLQNARALFQSHLQSVFSQKGESWVEKPFEDCIDDVTYTTKIQRKQFLEEGEFPIVSQEADFINGYWDNAADVFKVTRPLVVFGDHTQVLKYIDFDFVLGADGVKILQPQPFLNSKYFFYALRSAPLKSLGYARHYRLLKELKISYPDTKEQIEISKKLDALDAETQRLESLYQNKLNALDELKKSLLHQAFSGNL